MRQIHAEFRGSGSVEKGRNRTGVLSKNERGKEKLDLGVQPFRDLAGEGAWGGPEGLD